MTETVDHTPEPSPEQVEDSKRGMYAKFHVERTNPAAQERHKDCRVFVLEPRHDPHARPALAAYAASCAEGYPLLAADLNCWLNDLVGVDSDSPSHPSKPARLGASLLTLLERMGLRATPEERALDRLERDLNAGTPVVAVHHYDIEAYAKHHNEGYAEACRQFAEVLAEAREDLEQGTTAADLLGWLDDAVKAMGGAR